MKKSYHSKAVPSEAAKMTLRSSAVMPSPRTPPPATSAIVTVCPPSLKLFFHAFQILRCKPAVPTIGAESSPKTFPLHQHGSARFNDSQDETNADRAATPGSTSLSIGSAASRKVNRGAARVEGH